MIETSLALCVWLSRREGTNYFEAYRPSLVIATCQPVGKDFTPVCTKTCSYEAGRSGFAQVEDVFALRERGLRGPRMRVLHAAVQITCMRCRFVQQLHVRPQALVAHMKSQAKLPGIDTCRVEGSGMGTQ
jgi:hypothetical protein